MTEILPTMLDLNFLERLLINFVSLFVLIRLCYFRKSLNRDFLFSYFLFGVGVFIISYMLRAVDISLGFAFGLFAIFSMLRYRTESISIKEMTYLFLVISVALLCAVGPVTAIELLILNAIICGCTVLIESRLVAPVLEEKLISYEKIENIKPANKHLLIEDLRERTGLDIHHVSVLDIDFLRDTAMIKAYYSSGAAPSPITSKIQLKSTNSAGADI